ncbi:putative transcriptional regulator, CopG family [Sulfolobus islandicus Y.G.57.14]|uniref:Ribbon-helix-helix protein CopG domain-containing protein n=8 Tax=Saccharolobus islandicus TaxID=43080 RepID=M9UBN3_SACIS|nr:ribbon-helix-helix domain-containing protein [Sulfolobus islandicus]ACP34282.1 CopG domain protein DNA-binding domain protein [Sulfolobus islandicus L.S.2.15]ACP37022.1 putative transcriptional regulator, CopG family [Sulfolobus islandicus M.14.25]ACP44426.1 putative transcriptional regulator, CopG family [Sulfolobus islandicus Y.G.57.14]ACP54159.1 putative transcriptional regulator, CopG family [Sulfolobus islandicus M.16.27]ACR40767.1 putative transcriptional regulator, CopG family [Sulfo
MEKIVKVNDTTYILEDERSVVITFKLEENILSMVDEIVKKLGYDYRSDFIRDAIEKYINYLKSSSNNSKMNINE